MAQTKALWALFVSWSIGSAVLPPLVWAQAQPSADKAREGSLAEAALGRSAYEEAQRLARVGIESGSLGPEELAASLRVLAIASAHRSDMAAAGQAFTALLAVNPGFRLDRAEPDEIRSPYLEARGFWSAQPGPLTAKVARDDAARGLRVELVDPSALVARVRLHARVEGQTGFSESVLEPSGQMWFPIPELTAEKSIQYSVTLLDEFGNRILKLGSDAEPLRLAATAPPKLAAAVSPQGPVSRSSEPSTAAPPVPPRKSRRAMFIALGSVAAAVGVSGVAVGVRAHLEREQLAERWNQGSCSGVGSTRADLCADERSRIRTLEVATTALYSAGGAALITGAVLLLLTPARKNKESNEHRRRANFLCNGNVGWLGVSCSRAF